jgi:hypothetical protein
MSRDAAEGTPVRSQMLDANLPNLIMKIEFLKNYQHKVENPDDE